MKWREISTAPMDGRPVWVRGNDYGSGPIHCCWAWWDGSNWIEAGTEAGTLLYLTHWAELP